MIFFEACSLLILSFILCSFALIMLWHFIKLFVFEHNKRIVRLEDFKGFDDEHLRFVQYLFANEKYDYIASKENLSLSSVKRRYAELFKILGVPDLITFYSKFGSCCVMYNSLLVHQSEVQALD